MRLIRENENRPDSENMLQCNIFFSRLRPTLSEKPACQSEFENKVCKHEANKMVEIKTTYDSCSDNVGPPNCSMSTGLHKCSQEVEPGSNSMGGHKGP